MFQTHESGNGEEIQVSPETGPNTLIEIHTPPPHRLPLSWPRRPSRPYCCGLRLPLPETAEGPGYGVSNPKQRTRRAGPPASCEVKKDLPGSPLFSLVRRVLDPGAWDVPGTGRRRRGGVRG